MNFIQKIIAEKKLSEEQDFKRECSRSISYIEYMIKGLKHSIDLFINDRHDITKDDIDKLAFNVSQTEITYSKFISDLKKYEQIYKDTYFNDVKNCLKKKIEYMHKKKKEFRAEFESIYKIFKKASKGLKISKRNTILNNMRIAFDFDNIQYHKPVQVVVM